MTPLAVLGLLGLLLVAAAMVIWPFIRHGERAPGNASATSPSARMRWPSFVWGAATAIIVFAAAVGGYALIHRVAANTPAGDTALVPPDSMVAALQAAVERNPQDVQALLMLARAHFMRGEVSTSIATYAQILQINPRHPQALAELSLIFYQGNLYDLALRAAQRALDVDPDNISALWVKGQVLLRTGDDVGALQTWERFVQVKPDGDDAARARAYIKALQSRLGTQPAGR